MKQYTVIGINDASGEVFCDHVQADSRLNAFWVSAKGREEGVSYVVAIEGHHSDSDILEFPGDSTVGVETVLDQPEVFNNGSKE